jgi:hypothetical protein
MSDRGTIRFDQIPWEFLTEDSRQKRVVSHDRVLRLLELRRGFEESEWCRRSHAGYVVEGELQIQFDGSFTRLCAGDAIDLEGGEEGRHRASVVLGPVLLFLVEFA